MYFEATEDIRPLLNEGYQYVCTCLIDANGLKNVLGATQESSSIFSSCSESGANATVAANKDREAKEDAKKEAAAAALVLAAKNAHIDLVTESMTEYTDCKLKSVQSAKIETCYAHVYHMYEEALMLEHYWHNIVEYHGGDDAAPASEVTSKEEAEWTLKGTLNGLYELFPDRFDEDGYPLEKCYDIYDNASYGDDCTRVKNTYKNAIQIGDLPVYTSKPKTTEGLGQVDIECHLNDDALETVLLTGAENCELVEKKNGMF